MRMRKKKNQEERVAACAHIMVLDPPAQKGKWRDYFKNNNPIHIEIGCGKGAFILGMAEKYPDVNFVAIEREEGALIIALERAPTLPNLVFLSFEAAQLGDVFEKGEVSRLYLNFSDPWPANRTAKRRLTHPNFLKVYQSFLTGEIHFKTDNQGLFEFSLEQLPRCGFYLKNVSLDLHSSDFEGNIMTEYETRFSQMGQRIYRLEAEQVEAIK